MARTRGASMTGIQDPDGELIDKDGKPMPPPSRKLTMADVVVAEPQPEPEPPPPITKYVCTEGTVRRDIDAYTLMKLLSLAMGGGLEVTLAPDEWQRQYPDVKIHFLPVRG